MGQFKSGRLRKTFLVSTLSALLACMGMNAAQAQYSPFGGYSPMTGGNSLFYPMRLLLSPASMLFRGGYGYNAPYYLANTLTYNAAYAAGQGVSAVNKQAYVNRYWNPNNGINAPVVDQVSTAPWYYPPRGVAPVAGNAAASSPGIDPSTGSAAGVVPPAGMSMKDSEFMPVPAAIGESSPQLSPVQNLSAANPPSPAPAVTAPSAPDPAPDFHNNQPAGKHSKHKHSHSSSSADTDSTSTINGSPSANANSGSPSTGTSGGSSGASASGSSSSPSALASAVPSASGSAASAVASTAAASSPVASTNAANPFAQAFIDHVNINYSGNISKALSDKQTRGYAQALGILDQGGSNFDLPADRIELIKKIMQDPQEDSLTKVNTIRLLIKH